MYEKNRLVPWCFGKRQNPEPLCDVYDCKRMPHKNYDSYLVACGENMYGLMDLYDNGNLNVRYENTFCAVAVTNDKLFALNHKQKW